MSADDTRLDKLVDNPPKHMTEDQIVDEIVSFYPRTLPSHGFKEYEDIHHHAKLALPNAVAVEKQFPHTDHFITHFGMTDGATAWNTDAFFGERYVLSMQVAIKVNYETKTFVVIGEPTILLHEASNCDRSGHTAFNPRGQRELTSAEINTLIKSNWDWTCLKIQINPNPVPAFKIYEAMTRSPRYPINLTR